jgi:hypothetical protein
MPHAITLHQEQSLRIGRTIRVLVLAARDGRVRLGIEAPPRIDVRRDESASYDPLRRDLVHWHPDPQRLVQLIRSRFPEVEDDLRLTRTGVAYFGPDPCLFALMAAFTDGLRAEGGESSVECPESREKY